MAHSSPRQAAGRNLGDGRYGLWVPFAAKDQAKALTGARWDPGLKAWTVPVVFEAEARALIDQLNGTGGPALAPLLVDLFAALPEPLQTPTYRALAKLWHPDVGGDGRAMAALVGAWREVSP